ncbi:MAG: phosphoglycerate kinase [Parcubacteria group bacterium]|nr:phosphoglycerate kinase [Parcubacteria group bacterium]
MKGLNEIGDIRGKRVVVRAGLNVPVKDGKVVNDFRIRKMLPTLEYLSNAGARVIVIGHIGREGKESMLPVCTELNKYLKVLFGVDEIGKIGDGDVVLLENLRQEVGEVENDEEFAKRLASLADIYVNDAFSASHREHASIVGVPKFLPSYAGLQFEQEIRELNKAREPQSPSLFIIGGAKFQTKVPLMEKFLNVYDTVFVGGAIVNDFFKAKGFEVGKSKISETATNLNVYLDKVMLPSDVTVVNGGQQNEKKPEDVLAGDKIVDIGSKTLGELKKIISEARFILLNGPLGPYEDGFDFYTEEVVKSITESLAYSVVGGGDTIASIQKLNIEDKISFVSTGGGAMLQFLSEGTLPGIEALK